MSVIAIAVATRGKWWDDQVYGLCAAPQKEAKYPRAAVLHALWRTLNFAETWVGSNLPRGYSPSHLPTLPPGFSARRSSNVSSLPLGCFISSSCVPIGSSPPPMTLSIGNAVDLFRFWKKIIKPTISKMPITPPTIPPIAPCESPPSSDMVAPPEEEIVEVAVFNSLVDVALQR